MIGWFDSTEVMKFADLAARDLAQAFPKGELADPKRKSSARFSKAREDLLRKTHAFVLSNRMNLYLRARLGTRFKWALIEAGYPPEFVNEITLEMLKVAAAPKPEIVKK